MSATVLKRPLIVAHRGASGIAPENTLAAFRRAVDQGADMIELDVRMTQDFHIVVHHDRDLKRTTGSRGKVWELTLQQLRLLDAGSWFHPRFRGEQIPTLRQVLEAMPPHVKVNIEVKTDGEPRKRLAFEEVCILIIMEKKFEDRALVSSFDHKFLGRMHKLYPSIKTGALFHPLRDRRKTPSSIARKIGTSAFICSHSQLKQRLIEDARAHKIMTGVYVINQPEHLRKVLRHEVDAIITDFPGKIIRTLERLGYPSQTTSPC
jgi:glycerophosphoryl diester phosphodiesterase